MDKMNQKDKMIPALLCIFAKLVMGCELISPV